MSASFKKTGLKVLAAVVAVFAILIIALWVKFQFISEKALHIAGYTDASIGTARFTPAGSFFEDIKLTVGGTPVTVARVEAYATLGDALDGRLTKVVIDDAMIAITAKDDTEKDGGQTQDIVLALPTPLDLPVREIVFRNIRTFIPFAEGAPAVFSGSLLDRGAEYQLSGDYQITGDSLRAQGQLSIKAVKATSAISAQVDIGDAHLDLPASHLALRRGAGWITLEAPPDALAGKAWPVINAQLSAGSLKAYALPLQGLTLTAAIKPEKSEILLQGQGMDDSGEILAELRLDRRDSAKDSLKLLLDTKLKNLDALGVKDLKGRGQAKLDITAQKPRADGWLSWHDVGGGLELAAQKLSLPGLMRDVEAAASLVLSRNLADSTTVLRADAKPITLKGIILPIDAEKPVSLNLPANTKTPATVSWKAPTKQLEIGFQGLDISTPLVGAKNFSLALVAGFAGDYPALSGTLSAAELSHAAKPPAFVPVRLNGVIRADSGKANISLFNLDLTEKNGLLTVHINGQHDFAQNKGLIDLAMPQTTMRTGVYSLKDIFPLSAAYVQDVTGTLGMSAAFTWQKKQKRLDNRVIRRSLHARADRKREWQRHHQCQRRHQTRQPEAAGHDTPETCRWQCQRRPAAERGTDRGEPRCQKHLHPACRRMDAGIGQNRLVPLLGQSGRPDGGKYHPERNGAATGRAFQNRAHGRVDGRGRCGWNAAAAHTRGRNID